MAISFDWYENPVSPDKPEEKRFSSAHHRQRTDRHEKTSAAGSNPGVR